MGNTKDQDYFDKAKDSFVLDDGFTESNRFKRFTDLVLDKISSLILSHYSPAQDDMITNKKGLNPMFVVADFLRAQIINEAYYTHRQNKDDELNMETIYEMEEGFLRHPKEVPPLATSILWMTDFIVSQSIKITDDDRFSYMTGASAVRFATDTESYDKTFEKSLKKACWEYVREQAVADLDMDVSNWYSRLKNISDAEAIKLLYRLHSILLPEMENSAYIIMEKEGFKDTDDGMFSAALRWSNADLIRQQGLLQEEYKAECAKTQEKSEKINALNKEVYSLKQTVAELRKNEKKASEAIEESNKDKEKLARLQEKYDSLMEYVEMLEQQEEAELPTEESNQEIIELKEDLKADEELRQKRVLFVRETEFSKFTMMSQLAEFFPNSRFTNSAITGSEKPDIVVLLTRYVKHPTYFAVRDSAKAKKIPYLHCNCTNVNKVIENVRSGEQPFI